MQTPIVALIYDFDKTLSPKDMQEYSFIPGLDMEAPAFWGLCRELSLKTNMDGILAYMYMMKKLSGGTMELSREALSKLGEKGGILPRRGDVVRPRGRDRAAKRRLRGALHHLLRASGDHPRLAHRRPLQGGVRRLVLLRRAGARRMAGYGGQLHLQDAVPLPHQQGHPRRHQRPRPQRLHPRIQAPRALFQHDLCRRRADRRALHEDDQAEGRLLHRRTRAGRDGRGRRSAPAGGGRISPWRPITPRAASWSRWSQS